MAAYGRPVLRDLFDGSPTPHIAHPPRTHHRDFYVVTDGSFRDSGGGLGVLIETRDGERVARRSVFDRPANNNVAEYRALRLGLDVLADRAPRGVDVGVLVDHDALAEALNSEALAQRRGDWEALECSVPTGAHEHWRAIRKRIASFGAVRAARIQSEENPAHPLSNSPGLYEHVNEEPKRCVLPEPTATVDRVPPPSRADRPSSPVS